LSTEEKGRQTKKEKDEEGVSERIMKEFARRKRSHTGKGVLLGSEGSDKGILLFLGWGGES